MPETQARETWADVAGFPGYQVSDLGSVRSWKVGGRKKAARAEPRAIRPLPLPKGYLQVVLYRDGRGHKRYIHRLVLEAFIGPCPEGMQARHVINRDRTDNRLANLQWGTPSENAADCVTHGTRCRGSKMGSAKLDETTAAAIMTEADSGETVRALSARHGIRKENISKIINGHHWRHVEGPRKAKRDDFPNHVTSREAGEILGLCEVRIQQLIKAGTLKAVRYRRGWLLSITDVMAEKSARERKSG